MLCFYKMYIVVLAQLSVLYQWQSKVVGPVVSPLSHYYIDFINCGICTTDLPLGLKQSTASQSWKCHPTLEIVKIYLCFIIFGYLKSIYKKVLSDLIETWSRKSYLILSKHGRESLIWSYQNMVEKVLSDPTKTWSRKSYLILSKHGRESLIWSYQNMVEKVLSDPIKTWFCYLNKNTYTTIWL